MKQSKKQVLTNQIFEQVKILMSTYDESYTKASDEWILKQIENSFVSGGSKGYGFNVACHYKKYTLYTCYGLDKISEYISLISVSKNGTTLLGNFEYNNGLI